MRFAEHPERRHVVGEMHLRRFPRLALPAQAIQFARLLDDEERRAEARALADSPAEWLVDDARHRESRWSDDVRMSWERHSEASTATLTLKGEAALPLLWTHPDDQERGRAIAWVETLPGRVIRATHVMLVADEAAAAPLVEQAEFRASHLVSCHVAGGARMWSDFRIHDDGYGRLVIAANGLEPGDLARCVQRLQELGNYRNMALLGLPVAQAGWAAIDVIERRLEDTARRLHGGEQRDDDMLADLSALTATRLALAGDCDFRLSATAAYAQIVADRLMELDAHPIAGFPSLPDFIGRRFHPAMRTCSAFSARLRLVGERMAQFTALLRTRIETHIENQNARLLVSMDRSARMQLRLQHLVEGLSAVAIGYYALGLLSYMLKAVEKVDHRFPATLALGVAAPVLPALMFVAMGRLRRRVISRDDKGAEKGA
ncbi:putative membrane-anchored protein [Sphingobium sp. OAS761]|uniref:DUF3422 domain-containing protein n=1 Tax=Sphingobium sp. OAS761 TaxID=2817901 RepID=UPI00209DDD7C|nr:DUF3422 domain-containing protein [Sphingobium sp. OAS761]MCP1469741.1 putative membrane-anchored protein [Sphingobium sp. OAS761]